MTLTHSSVQKCCDERSSGSGSNIISPSGAKTHVTKPSALRAIRVYLCSLIRGPQDSLTNRNKLIAECSDSPAPGGLHELARPKQQWDDEKNEGGGLSSNSTLATGAAGAGSSTHGSCGDGCVEEGGPPRSRPREKHVEAIHTCMHAGRRDERRTDRSRWCGGYCICISASAFSTGPLSVSDVMPHILPPGMPFSERQRGQRLRSNSQGWHRGRAAVVCR